MRRAWKVHVTAPAEEDYERIILWSREQFGDRRAGAYNETLAAAIEALSAGPTIPGVKRRDDLKPGVMTLHVARGRRRGRHFLVFRVSARGDAVLELLRILHDAMDLKQHV